MLDNRSAINTWMFVDGIAHEVQRVMVLVVAVERDILLGPDAPKGEKMVKGLASKRDVG